MSLATDKLWRLLCKATPERVLKSFLGFLYRQPQVTDAFGFHVRPFHYYDPLPDFRSISREAVMTRRAGVGVDWNWDQQERCAGTLAQFASEISELRQQRGEARKFDFENPMFSPFDAGTYYSMVRALKPERIIEVGSGYSTQIAQIALMRNAAEGKVGRMTCIEPYPPAWFHDSGMDVDLLCQTVESVDIGVFKELRDNDILFIDSTHTVKFQSDVCREFLEIIPQLAVGVHVHVHDIFFPYDYPPEWLIDQRRAWNEQYLLEAFLAFNADFEVLLANHFLTLERPEIANSIVGESIATGVAHQAGSFWMRRKSVSSL